jgi:hypothetical protein
LFPEDFILEDKKVEKKKSSLMLISPYFAQNREGHGGKNWTCFVALVEEIEQFLRN